MSRKVKTYADAVSIASAAAIVADVVAMGRYYSPDLAPYQVRNLLGLLLYMLTRYLKRMTSHQ